MISCTKSAPARHLGLAIGGLCAVFGLSPLFLSSLALASFFTTPLASSSRPSELDAGWSFAGPENAVKYKDAIFLAGSASAELLADIALVPMETVKVRIQTTFPPFASGAVSGLNKVVATEGAGALYKSLPSLWGRQIPYTMMKFWSFEATVAKIYQLIDKPKSSYTKLEQLGVSATAGYIAGVFCAVVSHPADTMVSKLNAPLKPGQAKPTVGSIYSEIGFAGLWAGLGTRIFMIGTLTALQWVASGLPATGSTAEPTKKN
ncbi:Cu/Pi carrier [Rhodosporidiobolus nylandii]